MVTEASDSGSVSVPSEQEQRPAVYCVHCGLPVPPGLIDETEEHQFCCNGCRTVYKVIHGCGLDRFYKLRESTDAEATPAQTTDRQYGEFDDSVFHDLYVQQAPDETLATELYLEGVHCAACVWLVEKLPQVLPGVVEARLDMRRSLVRIRWDAQQVNLSRIARMLDSLGYPPHPARDKRARDLRRKEDHRFLIRIGVAAVCAGNVMTLAFALYGGVFTGIETQYSNLFRWASMGFGLISLTWPGSLFFRGAWAALRTRTAHLDLPIALGLTAGGVAGTVNAVLGRGEIYFDSLTVLVFLLLVGRWIQRRQQRWATDAIELLFSLTPTSARRVEEDRITDVPIEAIGPGDVVEVRAGESVPTDGIVVDGQSSVDQSLLTGESRPIAVASGDTVHAGVVNVSACLRVRVEAVGEHTRVGKLMRMVEECSLNKAPIVQMADRVAGWFVTVVLALAATTFGLWLWFDPSQAVDNSVALLIVTCPCALGLATPLAITVAVGRAARRGILVKGGEVLELMANRGTILLDKTGTITAGRTTVVSWFGDEQAKPLVAALEAHSAHPIATALVIALNDEEQATARPTPTVTDVQQMPEGGLIGTVDGRNVAIGSSQFVRSRGVTDAPDVADAEREAIARGLSPVLVVVDNRCVAAVSLGDPIREDVRGAIDEIRQLGWDVRILSGDHPELVESVGRELGIPVQHSFGGVTPEIKMDYVNTAIQEGRVVMVGDGVNDAAALSAATVGIAVHGGAEASLSAADVYLNTPGVAPIVDLIRAAGRTLRTIRRSLAVSLCYNMIAASLAVCGVIGPLVAAILMPISSFTVLALAYASPTFGDRT